MSELNKELRTAFAFVLAVAAGAWSIMLASILAIGHLEWLSPRYVFVGLGEFFLVGMLTAVPVGVPVMWWLSRKDIEWTLVRAAALGAFCAGGAWLLLTLSMLLFAGLSLTYLQAAVVFSAVAAAGGAIAGTSFVWLRKFLT